MTSDPGTYVLVIEAPEACRVPIGKLGRIELDGGWLVYVGSAFGSGGLRARVRRHLRDAKTVHWHIDHLLVELDVTEVWWTDDDRKWEEAWAEALRRMPDARTPLRRFGSGDCRCEGHLIHFPERPDVDELREGGPDAGHGPRIRRAATSDLSTGLAETEHAGRYVGS